MIADTLQIAFNKNANPDVATKADIGSLRAEISDLRAEMDTEFAKVRTEISLEFSQVHLELRESLGSFKIEMVKWIVGAVAFNLLGTVGLIIALVKYLGH